MAEKDITKRNEYWDVVRGIAIMNIVIGHVGTIPRPLAIMLNFYHCGIFFFISGALFKEKKDNWRSIDEHYA